MADQDYLVTARKYRPSLFKELVAQDHVAETLKNAIQHERLAHAYLFSGPRGVGKTTAARILAKAINCETPREEREDGAEPCCECDSCVSFEEGRSLNVFEMDAASNNKVDDVRELREKVRIPPQGEQKKVYILDEVHMLSKQAFNALLKTLEEPPAHALFIFATTEPHKVLPTILSRCQRFDFRRIPVPQIVDRLRDICQAEEVEADEESLMLLARKGNGALRDALSAFDQALSLCGTTLEYSELAQALGVVDQDRFFDLTDHVARRDTAGVLTLVRDVVRSGYDLQEFLAGLAEHLRNLLVAHSLGPDALEEVADSTRDQYADAADRFGEADLLRLLSIAGDAQDDVKNSPQPRLKLETTLLKMAQLRRAADLHAVIDKIDRLEEMVEEDRLPPSAGAHGDDESSGSSSDVQSEASSDRGTGTTTDPGSTSDPDRSARVSSPAAGETKESPEQDVEAESAPTSSARDEGENVREGASDGSVEPEKPTEEDAGIEEPGTDGPGVEYDDLFGPPALEDDSASAPKGTERGSGHETGNPEVPTDEDVDDSDARATVAEPSVLEPNSPGIAQTWPQFVKSVKADRISLGSLLKEAEPVEVTDDILTVSVPRPLHRETLRDERRVLLEHLTTAVEVGIQDIEFVVDDPPAPSGKGADPDEPTSPREKLQALRDTYPTLDMLFREFGAELVW